MSPEDYRRAIAALGLTQVQAADGLGINARTSRRYALRGVPDKAAKRVRASLAALTNRSEP